MDPSAVLELRRASGASLSRCKEALQACDGDVALAQAYLQKQQVDDVDSLQSATGLDRDTCRQLLDDWGSVERARKYLQDQHSRADAPPATPDRPWPVEVLPLEQIWRLNDDREFVDELNNFLSHKQFARKLPLSKPERAFSLVASMPSWIAGEGFQDLFYQQWSLADCHLVEATLKELGAKRLARLLREAREIYTRHQAEITEEEYRRLDPFDLPQRDGERFDEIADRVSADDSDLFKLSKPLAKFARRRRREFGQ